MIFLQTESTDTLDRISGLLQGDSSVEKHVDVTSGRPESGCVDPAFEILVGSLCSDVAIFNRHKVEYVERMRAVSEEGAWEAWFEFFLEGLRSQAEQSYSRTHRLRELQERYETEYPGSTATDRSARQLLQYPYFTAPDLVDYLDVSRRTAYKVVDELESDELIEEVTGKERGKEYKAVDVFEILR